MGLIMSKLRCVHYSLRCHCSLPQDKSHSKHPRIICYTSQMEFCSCCFTYRSMALWECKSFSGGSEVDVGMSARVKMTISVAPGNDAGRNRAAGLPPCWTVPTKLCTNSLTDDTEEKCSYAALKVVLIH